MITPEEFNQLRGAIVVLLVAVLVAFAGVVKALGKNAENRANFETQKQQAELDTQKFVIKVATDFKAETEKVRKECTDEIEGLKRDHERQIGEMKAQQQREATAVQQQVQGLEQQVAGMKGEVSALTDKNTQLSAQVNTLTRQNDDLLTANKTLQQQNTEKDAALTTERDKNGKLEKEVERMRDEVKSLTERLEAAEGRIEELQKKPDTGQLNPNNARDTDPADTPAAAPTDAPAEHNTPNGKE